MQPFAPRPPFLLDLLVERAAERDPGSAAFAMDEDRLTYEQLADGAARIAGALAELGVRPGDRVALLARKGSEITRGLYGVLRAGAVYVPLDPSAPPSRHAWIMRDAGIRVAIGESPLLARARRAGAPDAPRALLTGAILLGPSGPETSELGRTLGFGEALALGKRTARGGTEQDLAYLLYTSGSTGTPKGVMHTHRSALSFALWAAGETGLVPADRIANHAPFHFDLSTFDYFATAAAGACVHPIPSRESSFPANIAERTVRDRHSVVYATPSTWVLMMSHGRLAELDLSALRLAIYAGEVFPPASLARFLAALPRGARCYNLYGPTETNVCTYAVVTEAPAAGEPSNIGRACPNIELLALDEAGRPVATGEVGELWVRGGTVMQGYWGDPDRTARTLVQNPGHRHYPDPVCRTGDLVRPQADGTYLFLGRRDHQVKVRGYRVELGEVEAALASHPAVAEAVVVAVPHAELGAVLRAAVVPEPGASPDPRELARHCGTRLPAYMIPERIELRAALPRTASGKIDRRAVAEEDAAAGA